MVSRGFLFTDIVILGFLMCTLQKIIDRCDATISSVSRGRRTCVCMYRETEQYALVSVGLSTWFALGLIYIS